MKTDHSPQLFFSPDDLPRLRRAFAEDPRFAALRQSLVEFNRGAERRFLREEVKFNDPLLDFRRVHDCAQDMAFLHLMTGDEDAAALALESARLMTRFPVWDFFLGEDTGKVMGNQRAPSGTIALACVIDWLGDRIEPAERAAWLKVMGERGCEPCFTTLEAIRHYRQAEPWTVNPATTVYEDPKRSTYPVDGHRRVEITQDTNLRAAPASGLVIGAVCLRRLLGSNPDIERWLESGMHVLRVFSDIYLPDGSYGEGVGYANYTSESLFMAIDVLRRAGIADLRDGINWRGHVRFMLNMAAPVDFNPYEIINTGDAGRYREKVKFLHPAGRPESRSAVPFWVAREYRDGTAQWFADNLAAEHNLWSLVFFDETVQAEALAPGPQLHVPDVGWVVARTGFRSEDLVVNLRSGAGYNHEHADRNNLIVKAFGEPLVVDPLRPPYYMDDPAWLMRTTLGHSAVLVDGQGHYYHNGVEGTPKTHAQARLLGHDSGRGWARFSSDATQAYRLANAEIKAVVRTVVVLYDLAVVIVVDRLAKWRQDSRLEARFFGDNWDGQCTVSVLPDGFSIKRPGAVATATLFCREAVTVRTDQLPIPAERAVKYPFVAVETAVAADITLVTALALAPTTGTPAIITFSPEADEIAVAVQAAAGSAVCQINDRDLVPGIELEL
jgi:hypothetical protein